MSFNLAIGYLDKHGTFRRCAMGKPPHRDAWESPAHAGSPERSAGYLVWGECLELVPSFRKCWNEMIDWYEGESAVQKPPPKGVCLADFKHYFDQIESDAMFFWDRNEGDDRAAVSRALWFVRWCNYAVERYGEGAAAFEVPGEWK